MITEPESVALRRFLSACERVVSSELAEVELRRAARRQPRPAVGGRVEEVLEQIDLIVLTAEIRKKAALVDPPHLKSLDAIHLATALALDVSGLVFVGYDRKLQSASAAAGLEIQSPGA